MLNRFYFKGEDKNLRIVDLWCCELVKNIDVSKANLVSFKKDEENLLIHLLSMNETKK